MRKSTTRQKRQLQNRLQDDLRWYCELEAADYWADMMYREWQSEQDVHQEGTICQVQYEEGVVILLHHGPTQIEAANYMSAEQWFRDEP